MLDPTQRGTRDAYQEFKRWLEQCLKDTCKLRQHISIVAMHLIQSTVHGRGEVSVGECSEQLDGVDLLLHCFLHRLKSRDGKITWSSEILHCCAPRHSRQTSSHALASSACNGWYLHIHTSTLTPTITDAMNIQSLGTHYLSFCPQVSLTLLFDCAASII